MTSPRYPNTRTQTLGAPGKLWGVRRVGRWAVNSVWALGWGCKDSAFMEGSGSLRLCRAAACAPHTSPRMLDPPEFTWGRTAGGLLTGSCFGHPQAKGQAGRTTFMAKSQGGQEQTACPMLGGVARGLTTIPRPTV